jgi:type I restriction-modification system DNA methylase subunit
MNSPYFRGPVNRVVSPASPKLEQAADANSEYYIREERARYQVAEDRDEYIAQHIFWVPQEARWSYLRELNEAEIAQIAETYHAWRSKEQGGYQDIAGFCKRATSAELAGHGYVLTPGRYVGGV